MLPKLTTLTKSMKKRILFLYLSFVLIMYAQASDFNYLLKDSLWGLADSNMNIILSIDYQEVVVLSPTCILVKKYNKWALANHTGKMISPYVYTIYKEDFIHTSAWNIEYATDANIQQSKSFCPYIKTEQKAEATSANERIVINTENEENWEETDDWEAIDDSESMTEIDNLGDNESVVLIEIHGKLELVHTQKSPNKAVDYLLHELKTCGYIVMRKQEKKGLVNMYGKEIYPFIYDEISLLDNDKKYFIVSKNGKYGVTDTLSQFILKPEYAGIWTWNRRLLVTAKKQQTNPYNATRYFKAGSETAIPNLNYQYELFSFSGKKTIPPTQFFDMVALPKILPTMVSKRRYALVQYENKFGMINEEGKLKIPVLYNAILCLEKNNYPLKVCRNGKWGFLDAEGDVKIPLKYDKIGVFADYDEKRLAIVLAEGKYGLINDEGEVVVPIIYDNIDEFKFYDKTWTSIAEKNGKFGLIDYEGNTILPFIYPALKREANGKLVVFEEDNTQNGGGK